MDNYKFTKGQWVITEENSNGIIKASEAINIQQNQDDFFDICAVWRDVSSNSKECQYNALLISKAPEMLEMLKKLRLSVDWGYSAWGNDQGFILSEELDKLIKEATEL